MPRTRFSVFLYLFLVFGSGILVGIVSHRLYVTTTASANSSPRTLPEFRKRYLSEMRQKVGVNDQQVASVVRILDETKQKFDNLKEQEKPLHEKIQQEAVEAIRAELTDQQKIAYDNWRAERERARQAQEKPTR
jgi:uncharacterized protein YdiU (UPF0061 family)